MLGCLGSIVVFIIAWMLSGNFIVAIIIGFGLSLASLWYAKRKKTEQNDKADSDLLSYLSSIEGFQSSQRFISEDKKHVVAIDEGSKKVCFVDNNFGIGKRIYSYKELMRSEIVEDGVSITNTSRSSQLGGAILGGMIAGGVGAVVGALSGSQMTESHVKSITLQITTNDTRTPIQYIKFLFLQEAIAKNTVRYQQAIKEANRWHGLISVLIKRADQEEQENREREKASSTESVTPDMEGTSPPQVSPTSVADELGKLADLLKQGLITQEEFDVQKKRLFK